MFVKISQFIWRLLILIEEFILQHLYPLTQPFYNLKLTPRLEFHSCYMVYNKQGKISFYRLPESVFSAKTKAGLRMAGLFCRIGY